MNTSRAAITHTCTKNTGNERHVNDLREEEEEEEERKKREYYYFTHPRVDEEFVPVRLVQDAADACCRYGGAESEHLDANDKEAEHWEGTEGVDHFAV